MSECIVVPSLLIKQTEVRCSLRRNLLKIATGGIKVEHYLQRMEEFNLGPPNTNPSSGRAEDLNSGPRSGS